MRHIAFALLLAVAGCASPQSGTRTAGFCGTPLVTPANPAPYNQATTTPPPSGYAGTSALAAIVIEGLRTGLCRATG